MLYIAILQLLLVLTCIIHFIYQERQTAKKKIATLPVKEVSPITQQEDPFDGMTEEILEALVDYKRSKQVK